MFSKDGKFTIYFVLACIIRNILYFCLFSKSFTKTIYKKNLLSFKSGNTVQRRIDNSVRPDRLTNPGPDKLNNPDPDRLTNPGPDKLNNPIWFHKKRPQCTAAQCTLTDRNN